MTNHRDYTILQDLLNCVMDDNDNINGLIDNIDARISILSCLSNALIDSLGKECCTWEFVGLSVLIKK